MAQVVRLEDGLPSAKSDLGAVARGRGWRFAQLSIRHFLGLVYRVVALSPVMAASEV
jgi:hypothetical protein